MRQLDYRPNPAARALVTGRSRTLGVVSFDTTLYGPASTLFAIEKAAHAADYFVTIVSMPALDRRPCSTRSSASGSRASTGSSSSPRRRARSRRWSTCRRASPSSRSRPARRGGPGRRGRPVWRGGERHRASCSTSATGPSAHRRPARLGRGAAARRGLALDARGGRRATPPPLVPATGARARATSSGRRLAADPRRHRRVRRQRPDGARLLRALHEHGRQIPGDVSVVGFDDIPEARYFTPPLTTVRQDFARDGPPRAAAPARRDGETSTSRRRGSRSRRSSSCAAAPARLPG